MHDRIELSRRTPASRRRRARRLSSFENLERRELFSAQPPSIADAATYNAAFVNGVYQDALGRPADPTALRVLTQQIDNGMARGDVPSLTVHSAEFQADFVQAAYQQYLGRHAETAAVADWTRFMRVGGRDEQVAATLVASDEFYGRAGGNDDAWIAAAFQAMLGRAATANDVQSMTEELASGRTRQDVALQIALSPEHEGRVVDADYERYIHAAPDSHGRAFWTAQFATSQATSEDLAIDLMCGNTYYEQQTGVPPSIVPVPYDNLAWKIRNAQVTANAAKSTDSPVVFVGDSLTQAWQLPTGQPVWKKYFAPLNAFDAGVGGDTTQTLLWRVESGQLDGFSPKAVVLMVGVNNIIGGDSPQEVLEGVETDIAALHQRLPNSKILLLSILPAELDDHVAIFLPTIKATNQLLAGLDNGQNVFYQDLWSDFTNADGSFRPELHVADGVHLNTAGYTVLAHQIAPRVYGLANGS